MGIQIKVKNMKFTKNIQTAKKLKNFDPSAVLNKYGQQGLDRLRALTPVDTGVTVDSWRYVVNRQKNGYTLEWHNTSQTDGIPIVILLQFGHATRGGTYVDGIDFINPALKSVFENISKEIRKEVG